MIKQNLTNQFLNCSTHFFSITVSAFLSLHFLYICLLQCISRLKNINSREFQENIRAIDKICCSPLCSKPYYAWI